MKKINCDFCNKDISDEYNDDNVALSYEDRKFIDLCDDCMEKYSKVKDKCNKRYWKLRDRYANKLEEDMKKYYFKEIEKLDIKKE